MAQRGLSKAGWKTEGMTSSAGNEDLCPTPMQRPCSRHMVRTTTLRDGSMPNVWLEVRGRKPTELPQPVLPGNAEQHLIQQETPCEE